MGFWENLGASLEVVRIREPSKLLISSGRRESKFRFRALRALTNL